MQQISRKIKIGLYYKKITFVFINILVSTVVALIIANQIGNIASSIYRFTNPSSSWGPLGIGVGWTFFSIPVVYVVSIFIFAKVFVKDNLKENIIISFSFPLFLIILSSFLS